MFNLDAIFKTADIIADVTSQKQRKARQIRFFRYKEGNLGIAFYDNQTIHGEYWLENLPVPQEYEPIFEKSGFSLGTKYDIHWFGLEPFTADKKVLGTPAIQKRLLATIFTSIQE